MSFPIALSDMPSDIRFQHASSDRCLSDGCGEKRLYRFLPALCSFARESSIRGKTTRTWTRQRLATLANSSSPSGSKPNTAPFFIANGTAASAKSILSPEARADKAHCAAKPWPLSKSKPAVTAIGTQTVCSPSLAASRRNSAPPLAIS